MSPRLAGSDLPRGFSFAAASCGLKKRGLDLALFVSETPAAAAAVFTTNRVQAAPVVVSREHLARAHGSMRALVVNSGNANCATGAEGLAGARKIAERVASTLSCRPDEVLVCSTGVIGVPLRTEKILGAVPRLARERRPGRATFAKSARAILTTDTRPKWSAGRCRIGGCTVRLIGCAKGAGMIHPNLATMLAFVFTDARIAPALLARALRAAAALSFNTITVDGDTSTNDTVAVLANGGSGASTIRSAGADFARFGRALETVCRELSLAIVADGEGAQRAVEIEVCGAPSDRAADRVARTIANSALVKTALAGADPNWGRILAAAGRSGVQFHPSRVSIRLGGLFVCRDGRACRFDERAAHRRLLDKRVSMLVNLHAGCGRARVWTCDLTGEYVRINASYRT